jgi:succinyl-diaminopimelate desuccinylase
MDVVPAGDSDDWSVDPFGGVINDGRVFGRGATDMKGGLTAGMLAGRAAAESGAIDGRLVLAFSVGEETGEPGTLRLLERIDGDYGVVLEPTELNVHTASKGTAWYTVRIDGESSHASRPHLGSNPLLGLFSMVERLEAYRSELAEQTHPLLGAAMCTPTVCSAGSKENVVPSSAEVRFDRRFLPGDDVAEIDGEMDELFAPLRESGLQVSVERTQTFQPAEVSSDEEIAQTFLTLAEPYVSGSPGPAGKVGGTDQRFFVNEADIPAIVWGPGDAGQAHTVDESAEVEPVLDAIAVLCRAFDELLVSSR